MKRIGCVLALASLSTLVVSCGGGGGGMQTTPAPSGLKYPSPPAFVVQQPIAPLTPQVGGQVTGYAVTPTLPSGISVDASSGVISGTPTAVTPKTTYTITASNASGSTTTSVSLVVNDVAPAAITYQSPYYALLRRFQCPQARRP
jgi:putative Ig domain-containing protein